MGEMAIMSPRAGDLRVIWNPDNADEVKAAKEQFDSLRKKGHLAYSVTPEGGKGKMLTAFDASAEKIILAPPLRGG